MGNPLDRLVTEQARVNPLDALVIPPAQEPEDALHKYGNAWAEMGRTFAATVQQLPAAGLSISEQFNTNDPRFYSPEAIARRAQTAKAMGGVFASAKKTLDGILTLGSAALTQNPEAKAQVSDFLSRSISRVTDGLSHAQMDASTITNIPPMLVSGLMPIVTQSVEAFSGTPVGRYGETGTLTAEEQKRSAIGLTANILAAYAGGTVTTSLEKAAVPQIIKDAAAAGVTQPTDLLTASQELRSGLAGLGASAATRTRLALSIDHAITGTVAGATYGAVEGLGQDDELNKMINYGLVGMPLGVLMGFAHAKPVYTDRLNLITEAQNLGTDNVLQNQRADFTGKIRQLNLFETQNLNDAMSSLSSLNSSSTLARAITNHRLSQPTRFVLENVDATSAQMVQKAMINNDFERLRSQGMDIGDAATVSALRAQLGELSDKPVIESIPLGPINELNVNKILTKVRAHGGTDVTAGIIRSQLSGTAFPDIQAHATIHDINGNLLPTEAGLHFGNLAAAHEKIGYFNPITREDLLNAAESTKLPFIKETARLTPEFNDIGNAKNIKEKIQQLPTERVSRFNSTLGKRWRDVIVKSGGHIFPFFAIVRNPLELPDVLGFNSERMYQELRKRNIISASELDQLFINRENRLKNFDIQNPEPKFPSNDFQFWHAQRLVESSKPVIELLQSKGYDGLKYVNKYEAKGSISGAVFDPDTQIMYLTDILRNAVTESQSPKFRAINDMREIYDFYPNEFNSKSQIPSYAVRANPDGTFHVAFSYGLEPFSEGDILQFQKTGYMQGQPVNYHGKPAQIEFVKGDEATISTVVNGEGTQIKVPLDQITTRPESIARAKILATDAIYQDFIDKSFRAEPTTGNNSKLVESIPAKNYKLPKQFEKAAPRYGKNTIQFESDFDRGAYIAGSSKAEQSATAQKLLKHIEGATGFTAAEIREHRGAVLSTIKSLAKSSDGKNIVLPRVITKLEGIQRLIPISEVAQRIPAEGQSWNSLVNKYALENGYSETDIPDLSRQLSARFFQDIAHAGMDPAELKIMQGHQQTLNDILKTTTQPLRDLNTLDNALRVNGQYLESVPGALVVKDTMTGRELYRGKNVSSVVGLMKKAGASEGISGDGGNNGIGTPPPDAVAPSGNAGESPFKRRDTSFFSARGFQDFFDSKRFLTKRAEFFQAIDRKFGTDSYQQLYRGIQNNAEQMGGDYLRLVKPLITMQRFGLTAEERLLAGDLLESYSADDIRTQGYYKGKPATQIEDALGTELGNNVAIDINKIANYTRILDATYATDQANFQTRMTKVAQDLQMNQDELAFVQKMKQSGELSYGTTYALAQAVRGDLLGTPFLNRVDFIEQNKVPEKVQKFAEEVDKHFGSLGDEFGVPKDFRISAYMTHKRLYGFDDYTIAKGPLDVNDTAYFKLNRNGLLQEYERDPLFALAGYIRAGLSEKYISPSVDKAVEYLNNPTFKETLGDTYDYVRDNFEGYVRDNRGIPDASTKAANDSMRGMLEKLGLGNDLRRVASTLNGVTDAAFQGGSMFAAMRDLFTGWANTSSLLGWNDGKNIIKKGITELIKKTILNKPNVIDDLMDRGIVKQITVSGLETPEAAGASFYNTGARGFARAAEKLGRVGLITSGQPLVYEALQAGTYLHVWERAGETIKQFRDGDIGKVEFSKLNRVSAYDETVTKHFNDLIDQNKDAEAADYLAREAIGITQGRYGHGNAPYDWTSWWMRLVGQYGQYTVGHKSFLLRGLSNGNFADRFGFATRYATINAILLAGGYYSGTNLYWRLAPITGLGYTGGPATSAIQALLGSVQNNNGFNNGVNFVTDILPYNQNGWNLDHAHAWLPFSKAINDYLTAASMITNNEGTGAQQSLRAFGMKPTQ